MPQALMRWSVGWFGVKDLFTMINLLGGVMGFYWAAQGHPDWAGYAILGGYFFGDAVDGLVARATNTGNRFGAEFDSAADHVGQGLAPAMVVFSAYRLAGQTTTGLVLMALIMSTASIRQARFNVNPFDFPLAYCGLPRTVSGIVVLALPNSVFFSTTFGQLATIPIIVLMALGNLIPVPYMTHRGKRRMQGYVKFAVFTFLTLPFVVFALAREYVFDVMFIYGFGYALLGWAPLSREERSAFFAEYRRWNHVVSTLR